MTTAGTRVRTPRRAVFAVVDAGVSSLGNFAFSWIGALTLSLTDFGLLSLAMVVGLLSQALVKALIIDAYTLGYAGGSSARQRTAGRAALGAVLVAAIAWSVCVACVWAVTGSAVWAALAVAGVPLALHDSARWIAFARGRVGLAAFGTGVWTLLSAVSVGVLVAADMFSPTSVVLCWGLTSSVSALLMIRMLGVAPQPSRTAEWFREHRGVGMRSSLDFGLTQSVAYGGGIILSAVAGPAAFGLLRLAQLPLAAVQVVIAGSVSAMQPALVRRIRSSQPEEAGRMAATVGIVLVVATLTCTATVVLLPNALWAIILGESWPDAAGLVPILAAGLVGSALASSAGPLLRAQGMLHREVVIKSVVTPVTITGIALGAGLGGVVGGSLAMSSGALVVGIVLTVVAYRCRKTRLRAATL